MAKKPASMNGQDFPRYLVERRRENVGGGNLSDSKKDGPGPNRRDKHRTIGGTRAGGIRCNLQKSRRADEKTKHGKEPLSEDKSGKLVLGK